MFDCNNDNIFNVPSHSFWIALFYFSIIICYDIKYSFVIQTIFKQIYFSIGQVLPPQVWVMGLYTPISYFGRYATCSHKDGGHSHIQSRETIGQEDHVTCLKLRPRVNSSPAFWATYKTHIFYKYIVFKPPFSLLHKFFAAETHSLQCKSTGEKSNNMDGPRRHSKYTLTMRRCPFLIIKKGHC